MGEPVAEAIIVVAQQLLANAARDITWEDMPDVGESDWNRVALVLDAMAAPPAGFDAAVTLLQERAAAWEAAHDA